MDRILYTKMAEVKQAINTEQEKLLLLMNMNSTMQKERTIMVHDVKLQKLPAVKVLSLRGTIPLYRDEYLLWERLGTYIDQHQIAWHNNSYSLYLDEEYQEENPEVEVAISVDELGENDGEFIYQEYSEIPLAATVCFSGPFDGGYDAASEKLAAWMEAESYGFAGHLRGHVIVSPDENKNPEEWLTELQPLCGRCRLVEG